MTKIRLFVLQGFLLFFVLRPDLCAFALQIPPRPLRYIYDGAGLLSESSRAKLDIALRSFEDQTTNQIFIATFPSLEGESLEDYSIRLADAWKVGQKGRDNGVILVIFRDDRIMRIEVGYGLEGALPDALAGQIIQNSIAPYFETGDFEQGISRGVDAIMRAVQGEHVSALKKTDSEVLDHEIYPDEDFRKIGIFVFSLMAILLMLDLIRYQGYSWTHRVYAERYDFWEWWFRFGLLLAVLSMLFRIMYFASMSRGGGYYGSRSGFRGGFSGSGGGRFGGGGASGRW